jgi:hypothetical protein
MDKVATATELVLVDEATEFHVPFCLIQLALVLGHPHAVVPLPGFSQFLQQTKFCAWRRADDTKWLFPANLLKCLRAMICPAKVPAIGQIK